MKRLLTSTVAARLRLSIVSCDTKVPPETTDSTTADVTGTETEKETDTVTDIVTEEVIVDEDPVFYEKTDRDPIDPANAELSSTDWNKTIVNANASADVVSGLFVDPGRKMFRIINGTSSLVYNLTEEGNKQVKGLYNSDGKAYFTDTMDVYVINSAGEEFSAAHSLSNGRMNSNRLGYYYYDFRFRDQTFIKADDNVNEEIYDMLKETGRWSGNDVNKIKKVDGTISYNVTGALDPYIYSSVNYSADKFNAVKLPIKTEYSSSV